VAVTEGSTVPTTYVVTSARSARKRPRLHRIAALPLCGERQPAGELHPRRSRRADDVPPTTRRSGACALDVHQYVDEHVDRDDDHQHVDVEFGAAGTVTG
jgi:hypothetical protein